MCACACMHEWQERHDFGVFMTLCVCCCLWKQGEREEGDNTKKAVYRRTVHTAGVSLCCGHAAAWQLHVGCTSADNQAAAHLVLLPKHQRVCEGRHVLRSALASNCCCADQTCMLLAILETLRTRKGVCNSKYFPKPLVTRKQRHTGKGKKADLEFLFLNFVGVLCMWCVFVVCGCVGGHRHQPFFVLAGFISTQTARAPRSPPKATQSGELMRSISQAQL